MSRPRADGGFGASDTGQTWLEGMQRPASFDEVTMDCRPCIKPRADLCGVMGGAAVKISNAMDWGFDSG